RNLKDRGSKMKSYSCMFVAFFLSIGTGLQEPAGTDRPFGVDTMKTSGSWSGAIINNGCTPDEAFAEVAKCTDKLRGTRLGLYDDTTREIYDLEPQVQAVGHLGDAVTVHGALEANTIHVVSLELLTSIGLAIGQKAPAFSARDQFGREQ